MVWSYCGSGWGWDTQSYSVRQLLTCVVLGGLYEVLARDEYIGNCLWLFPGQLCNLLLTYKLTVVVLVKVYYDHEEDVLWIGTRSISTVAHPPWQTGARQSERMGIGIMFLCHHFHGCMYCNQSYVGVSRDSWRDWNVAGGVNKKGYWESTCKRHYCYDCYNWNS